MRDYTGAARDYALEVRTHGDVFSPYAPVDPAAPDSSWPTPPCRWRP